jgi:chromosome partitioning protein
MAKIAVINQKGGVGKTTTTANLGAALARKGKKVLLLDMDPQANLTLHLDRRPDLEAKTMTNVLVDDAPLRDVIVPTAVGNLDIAPADTSLAGVEQVLANRIGRETILREAFEALAKTSGGHDFMLLDCPPSLGVLAANALVAADAVLVPVQTEYFALQGMAKLFEVIELVKRRLNPQLAVAAILPCMVDVRTNLTAEVLGEIERHFGRYMARSFIRANVKLAEAPSFGRTIFEHAPDSNGAHDYLAFAAELLGERPAAAPEVAPARTELREAAAES